MTKYATQAPDGLIRDLPESAMVTMQDIPKRCGECHELLSASSRREYCPNCGVWWWRDKSKPA